MPFRSKESRAGSFYASEAGEASEGQHLTRVEREGRGGEGTD